MIRCAILLGFACVCLAASVPSNENVIPIVAAENVIDKDGTFHYSYESGDGTKVHEEGVVKAGPKPEEGVESVQGGFEFSSPEGKKVQIEYIADENGYQPQGDILPVTSPVPDLIAKSLKFLAEHPPPKELSQ